MKNKLAKLTSALLAAFIAASLFACGGSGDIPSADTTASDMNAAETAETTAAETFVPDNLPERDFGGYSFKIGASTKEPDWIRYIYAEEMNGETVNDAVYKANLAVSERFNITLDWAKIEGDNLNGIASAVKSSVFAGDYIADVITMHDCTSATAALQGIFLNVHSLPFIDFEQPWWPHHTTDSLTLNNKLYFIANDMSYYGLYSTRVLFANLGLMESLGIEKPFDKVRARLWFLDDLVAMTKDVYEDLDGDSERTLNDRYGFALTGSCFCFLESFNIETFTHSQDGAEYVINIDDRLYDAVQKSCDWFFGGSQGVYYNKNHAGYFEPDSSLTMFANGNALFALNSVGRLVFASQKTEVPYGIVPMPMLDEIQGDYVSGCVDNPICIPLTSAYDNSPEALERLGVVIEAMSAEGYRTVQPAYKDIALKIRYANDKDSSEMLDIIYRNRLLSAAYLYTGFGFQMAHEEMWQKRTTNIDLTSYIEKNTSKIQKQIDKINEFYRD